MSEILTTALSQFQQSSLLELCAVVLAVVYLLLAVRQNIACWYAAFISTAMFLYIFWQVDLFMESGLQIFYLVMAVYGWYQWRYDAANDRQLLVTAWTLKTHLLVITGVVIATIISGTLLADTQQRLGYVDSFTTWGAIVTTYMVARKVLENWIYWLVIDSVSIYLYLDRELYFTALLFFAYLFIVVYGFWVWLKDYKDESNYENQESQVI